MAIESNKANDIFDILFDNKAKVINRSDWSSVVLSVVSKALTIEWVAH